MERAVPQSGVVTSLFRYPVKGLSPEPLADMVLRAGFGLAGDRMYALALGDTRFDEAAPVPLAKTNFLMLARNEFLAALSTRYDEATVRLSVRRGDEVLADEDLRTASGHAAIGELFTRLAGPAARGDIRLVTAPGHRFTDIGAPVPAFMNCISLINLASLRDLEATLGRSLDQRRFRANVYADGIPAWAELDWVGREVTVGGKAMRVVRRTRRCPATNVNPVTAERDADLPKALLARYGHADLGVYLQVLEDTTITVGQSLDGPA
jgi:uncharacterized protein YcbX